MDLTQEQFEVFIMVYASHADFKEMPLERDFVIRKYGNLRYDEALNYYNLLSEPERVKLIINHLDDFKDSDKRIKLISEIKTLLDFDGFNRFEETFYNYLSSVTSYVKDDD